MNELKISAEAAVLLECRLQSRAVLAVKPEPVETGGIILGGFDGQTIAVRRFLLDEEAVCTPASIELTSSIFLTAERVLSDAADDQRRSYLVGTWHTHPPGFTSYSSTDASTLFRERMRLRTDDPSLASTPWVHFIVPNYGIDNQVPRVFTMRVGVDYHLKDFNGRESIDPTALGKTIESGVTLGLLVRGIGDFRYRLAPYHPTLFERHRRGEIQIAGLWRHYEWPTVIPEFEKVFLENFFQKYREPNFVYTRVLNGTIRGSFSIKAYDCSRPRTGIDLLGAIKYTELQVDTPERT